MRKLQSNHVLQFIIKKKLPKATGMLASWLVSMLNSRSSGLGLNPGWGIALGKALYSHKASLHPDMQMVPAGIVFKAWDLC